jgi:predicted transglutaminase-like cysteine proteinase
MKMKKKYLNHLQHLSAILTVAMLCIQGAAAVFYALENHHTESQPLVDHLTNGQLNNTTVSELKELGNDQLNSMTVSQLKELNLEVNQELKQKLHQ